VFTPLFLDTEFTSFGRMDLVSIALVTLDGAELYAEIDDHDASDRSEFVHRVVMPLLRGGESAMPRAEAARRLLAWLASLPGPLRVVCDYEGDFRLLSALLGDAWPGALNRSPLAWTYGLTDAGPATYREAKRRAWEAAQRHFLVEPQHNALHDARAMRAAWLAESEI
jgi:hypothetical protein